MNRKSIRKQHFVLLELAVVAVCAVLLTAMLRAVVGSAWVQARGTECRAQMKVLAVGAHQYREGASILPCAVPVNGKTATWSGLLANGKFVSQKVYACPARKSWGNQAFAKPDVPDAANNRWLYPDYGVTYFVTGTPLNKVAAPAEKLWFGETMNGPEKGDPLQQIGFYRISDFGYLSSGGWGNVVPIHNLSANLVWFDGHASSMEANLPGVQGGKYLMGKLKAAKALTVR